MELKFTELKFMELKFMLDFCILKNGGDAGNRTRVLILIQ